MRGEGKKRCSDPTCMANIRFTPQEFPARTTKCPLCNSPLVSTNPRRAASKGSAKGGGKTGAYKVKGNGLSKPKPHKKKPKKPTLRKGFGRKR
jgi:hypothetical protein